ncbi:hypothetical protein HMN09_00451700 [Mycena chlorophos]|uniref:Indole-diterpene biosynthesis protein n=1 Tax=Mycena chlorophos TaxID=658473 RepID=A0A8H6TGB2_MYCCL|nr:hypothetical protein HMN09_00451700 [Mycena chlorophos]
MAITTKTTYTALGQHAFVYHAAAESTGDSDVDPTLILIFGWMAAQRAHLLKYTEPYRLLYPGATIIVVRSHLSFYTTSWSNLAARFKPVIDLLEALGCFEGRQRILTHTFSNGGSTHLQAFSHLLASRQLTSKQITTRVPPNAFVIDSSPGGFTFALMVRAMVSPIKSAALRFVARVLSYTSLLLGRLINGVILRRPHPFQIMVKTLQNPRLRLLPWMDPAKTPRLYLYSMADAMVPWQDVDAHYAVCERAGMDVRRVKFAASPHVAHARVYPEEYWGAVKSVWEHACTAADT